MRFFFYGTLLDRDVTALVLGRRLPPQAFVPATLPGHSRWRVQGGSYPVVGAAIRGAKCRARSSAVSVPATWRGSLPMRGRATGSCRSR